MENADSLYQPRRLGKRRARTQAVPMVHVHATQVVHVPWRNGPKSTCAFTRGLAARAPEHASQILGERTPCDESGVREPGTWRRSGRRVSCVISCVSHFYLSPRIVSGNKISWGQTGLCTYEPVSPPARGNTHTCTDERLSSTAVVNTGLTAGISLVLRHYFGILEVFTFYKPLKK